MQLRDGFCLRLTPPILSPAETGKSIARENPFQKRHGSSGKATANLAKCCCCAGSLSKDGYCRNRACRLFMAEAREIDEFRRVRKQFGEMFAKETSRKKGTP